MQVRPADRNDEADSAAEEVQQGAAASSAGPQPQFEDHVSAITSSSEEAKAGETEEVDFEGDAEEVEEAAGEAEEGAEVTEAADVEVDPACRNLQTAADFGFDEVVAQFLQLPLRCCEYFVPVLRMVLGGEETPQVSQALANGIHVALTSIREDGVEIDEKQAFCIAAYVSVLRRQHERLLRWRARLLREEAQRVSGVSADTLVDLVRVEAQVKQLRIAFENSEAQKEFVREDRAAGMNAKRAKRRLDSRFTTMVTCNYGGRHATRHFLSTGRLQRVRLPLPQEGPPGSTRRPIPPALPLEMSAKQRLRKRTNYFDKLLRDMQTEPGATGQRTTRLLLAFAAAADRGPQALREAQGQRLWYSGVHLGEAARRQSPGTEEPRGVAARGSATEAGGGWWQRGPANLSWNWRSNWRQWHWQ